MPAQISENQPWMLTSTILKMPRSYPELSPQFTRPASVSDVLHEPQPSVSGWVRIERSARQPNEVIKVHYGPIATGNVMIKTAHLRDLMSKSLGGVLCFEKVAADLAYQMPCTAVIRGICDYADAHINMGWQEYAAAVAAAYAKEVVLALPATMVDQPNENQEQGALAAGRSIDAAATIQQNKNFGAYLQVGSIGGTMP